MPKRDAASTRFGLRCRNVFEQIGARACDEIGVGSRLACRPAAPDFHERRALVEVDCPQVGGFGLVSVDVRERGFLHLPLRLGESLGPVPERAPHAMDGCAGAQDAKRLRHGVLGDRTAGVGWRGKDEIGPDGATSLRLAQDGDGGARQRDEERFAPFHVLAGDAPLREVFGELRPCRLSHGPRARGREDGEAQREGADAFRRFKIGHERDGVLPRNGGEMGHLVLLARQGDADGFDRVRGDPVFLDQGPVENRFHALKNAASGFGFREPDRFEDCEDVRARDVIDAGLADVGECVGPERVQPLVGVLAVAACGLDLITMNLRRRPLEGD